MLQIPEIQTMIASTLFNGDTTIAGLAMFAVIVGIIFLLFRNIIASLLVTLPIIMIASTMGIISGDMMILLIIITVLGLALTARNVLAG